jgi:hypothetical protein
MNTTEPNTVSAIAMGWMAEFWEGKVAFASLRAHTTPEPDDMPPTKNDPAPLEVPQPPPVQDPTPQREPVKRVG